MIFSFDGERIGPWVHEKAGGQYVYGPCIGVEKNGELIAGVSYDGFTGSNITGNIRCDKANGLPRKFFWMIFDYPFNQLKVKRISAIVGMENHKSRVLVENMGFRREATLRDYFPDGDAIVYVMRKDDCRFLGGRYVSVAQAT